MEKKKEETKKEEPTRVALSGCTFTGVSWSSKAAEAVNDVARGLMNLTELFKSQNIKIDTLFSVNGASNTASEKPFFFSMGGKER